MWGMRERGGKSHSKDLGLSNQKVKVLVAEENMAGRAGVGT